MKGFYTKEEAAQVLGVSVRQISNYFTQGKLSKVYQGRRAWIPQDDVQTMYDKVTRGQSIKPKDVYELQDRMDRVEQQIETLKKGLGFGSKRPARSDADLLALRKRTLDSLSKQSWGNRQMYDMAEELMTVQPDEIAKLADLCGSTAWVPFVDLTQRMLAYIERHPTYPDGGLDILETRLIRARDRFYGLVYTATKTQGDLPPNIADRVFQSIQVPTNSIEQHIVKYLLAK